MPRWRQRLSLFARSWIRTSEGVTGRALKQFGVGSTDVQKGSIRFGVKRTRPPRSLLRPGRALPTGVEACPTMRQGGRSLRTAAGRAFHPPRRMIRIIVSTQGAPIARKRLICQPSVCGNILVVGCSRGVVYRAASFWTSFLPDGWGCAPIRGIDRTGVRGVNDRGGNP